MVLEDTFTKGDPEFVAITFNAKHGYEGDFAAVAGNLAISEAIWDWGYDFRELQFGLVQRLQACDADRERKVSVPLQAVKTEWVGSSKSMTTKATLYRDGNLLLEVNTVCSNPFTASVDAFSLSCVTNTGTQLGQRTRCVVLLVAAF